MNKKLLTLAVAGTIVGAVGVAQADATVYGKAHVSIETIHVDSTTGYANDANLVVANNSSRLGFKFSEDLGGGFIKKAIGQYETAVGIDGEASSMLTGNRNSYLGLETAAGTVIAGIHDTPMKSVGRAVELFPEYVGDARNLISNEGGTTDLWDQRTRNTIMYSTPSMAGVQAVVAYSADTAASATTPTPVSVGTDDNNNRLMSMSVSYKGGPIYVGAAYEVHVDPSPASATDDDESAWRLAASGTFGMFRAIALYQQSSNEGNTAGTDRSVYGIGGAVTLAEKHVIKAQYYNADPHDNTTSVNENGASMFAVGYDYKFSKKTTGYIAYAKTSNDTAGDFTVNWGGHGDTTSAGITGTDIGAVSAGMIMDF